jgi:hypothetical protein
MVYKIIRFNLSFTNNSIDIQLQNDEEILKEFKNFKKPFALYLN